MTIIHIHGEACEELEKLESESVSLILTDPPYAMPGKACTANEWDKPPDWPRWWKAAWNSLKPNGAILLFCMPPFSFDLMMEPLARKNYRYDWVWEKERGSNFQHANRMPMKTTEYIHVFYKAQPAYNPIKTDLDKVTIVKPYKRKVKTAGLVESSAALWHPGNTYVGKYPTNILKFSRDRPMVHPTQKPVKLLKYLIQTYTNNEDTVVDTFSGYGSTMIACENIGNRNVIGIELDKDWFIKSENRLVDFRTSIHEPAELVQETIV